MNYQQKIATTKTERTFEFIKTGVKVGGNYVKHFARKTFNPDSTDEILHNDNAEDIYNSLSKLKGSALKVAQMLSMDKGLLPKAYADKFSLSQYQAPPLSAPLVVQTFQKTLGKSPSELFDSFDLNAGNAASIGQVHKASLKGKKLAVKVQYPGVAESIKSDLKLVKPIATRMFNLSEADLNKYMGEVEEKLLEETDYLLELKRSQQMADAAAHLDGLKFPQYYKELSSKRIITMDFLEGFHLNDFLQQNPSQETKNLVAQRLWDFFEYQMHQLRFIHADPHPGNFLFNLDGTVGVIDFGCMKQIPEDFYYDYFALILPEIRQEKNTIELVMERIEMIYPKDSDAKKQIFKDAFLKMTSLLSKPFETDFFDFGNSNYIEEIYKLGEEIGNIKEIRDSRDGRGSRHMLYINRTYFGLYNMMNALQAQIKTKDSGWRDNILNHFAQLSKEVLV
jgi:predicted unusual protein kinase regulating ubiquinone biosynthesis (AarF/ABC1/UbiB family)